MKQFPSTDLTRRSGELLDAADKAPVSITRYRRPRYVILSVEEYAKRTGEDLTEVFTKETMTEEVRHEIIDAIDKELTRE